MSGDVANYTTKSESLEGIPGHYTSQLGPAQAVTQHKSAAEQTQPFTRVTSAQIDFQSAFNFRYQERFLFRMPARAPATIHIIGFI